MRLKDEGLGDVRFEHLSMSLSGWVCVRAGVARPGRPERRHSCALNFCCNCFKATRFGAPKWP